jgi:tRNA-modifying protein YgfZ
MAFLVPADLARVDVTGAERADYLQTVTSQDLSDARPGQVRGALYLDAHGAAQAIFDVAVLPDVLALLAPTDLADEIVEVLGGRTFLTDASFARTDDVALRLRGVAPGAGRGEDDAGEVAAAAGLDVEPAAVARRDDGLLVVGRAGGIDLVGDKSAVDDAAEALRDAGATEGTDEDYEAWRVAAGVPAWGREVVAPHLPEELGLLPTHVHLAKGCYPGQEAVARMWMLGRPRKRLAVVAIAEGEVAAGTTVGAGRRKATVTSVAPDGRTALAMAPGDAEAGTRLADEEQGIALEVVRVVGAGLPVPGHDPAMTRRRDTR